MFQLFTSGHRAFSATSRHSMAGHAGFALQNQRTKKLEKLPEFLQIQLKLENHLEVPQ